MYSLIVFAIKVTLISTWLRGTEGIVLTLPLYINSTNKDIIGWSILTLRSRRAQLR